MQPERGGLDTESCFCVRAVLDKAAVKSKKPVLPSSTCHKCSGWPRPWMTHLRSQE